MICGKICFLQFLTSQGDMLRLIYVGAAVNSKVFRCGRGAGRNQEVLKVGAGSQGQWSWYKEASSARHCLGSSRRGFALQIFARLSAMRLEGEETVWTRTDLGRKVLAKYAAAVGLDQSQTVKN